MIMSEAMTGRVTKTKTVSDSDYSDSVSGSDRSSDKRLK